MVVVRDVWFVLWLFLFVARLFVGLSVCLFPFSLFVCLFVCLLFSIACRLLLFIVVYCCLLFIVVYCCLVLSLFAVIAVDGRRQCLFVVIVIAVAVKTI